LQARLLYQRLSSSEMNQNATTYLDRHLNPPCPIP